jgi:hypothetical protein
MKVVYVAHRLNAETESARQANRESAERWVAWLAANFKIAPIADWVVLSKIWPETMRERGLAVDLKLVSRADEVWLVGPVVSAGMQIEADHARALGKRVRDLTGSRQPWLLTSSARSWFAARLELEPG